MKLSTLFHCICVYTLCCIPASVMAQTSFDDLMEQGKAEFKKDHTEQSYTKAATYLEQAVALQPNSAEAHYYLGYAYDRINSNYGSDINGSQLQLSIAASEEFETVNKLEPKYKGSYVVLDPYTKLTAIWGSLAYRYLHEGKDDSVKWALKEGRKRGGFSDYSIAAAKNTLQATEKNSLLFSYGDLPTFSLLYVQQIEKERTDVLVMDQGLLFANWFIEYLYKNNKVKHKLNLDYITKTDYEPWADSLITIPISGTAKSFSWMMAPTYSGEYIGKGNIVLLDILSSNKFEKETYFMNGGKEEDIGIADHYTNKVSLYYLNVRNKPFSPLAATHHALPVVSKVNKNSKTEMDHVDILRYNVVRLIAQSLDNSKPEDARLILAIYDKYLPEKEFPTLPEVSKWLKTLRK